MENTPLKHPYYNRSLQLSKNENPKDFEESKEIANRGGNIAGNTRREIESNLGHSIVSKKNSKNPKLLDEK